jgi:hypothetical protein
VLAYENLCCSNGAKIISLISTAYARYLTIIALNCCNMARALIGFSMNYHTCPDAMSSTFVISTFHDDSCSACDLTMPHKSTNSLGVPNSGTSMSHFPIDIGLFFLSVGPFLLDFPMRLLSHFNPIFG